MEGYFAGAIATWNQGAAGAHLCVLQTGEIVRTVLMENIAWHAGTDSRIGRTAFWKSHNINPFSIGVEIEGFAGKPFTHDQAIAIRKIAVWAEATYGIAREHTFDQIAGHHAHSELSNQRGDPGPTFDWSWVTA